MSDGISEAYREKREAERVGHLVTSLLAFVLEDTSQTRALATLAADSCQSIPRDFFGEKTDFATDFDSVLKKLTDRDTLAWAKLLCLAFKHGCKDVLQSLRAQSPWPNLMLAVVRFGSNSSEFANILRPAMSRVGNATEFWGNPSGHFTYAFFYNDRTSLLEMAHTAVPIETHIDRCSSDRSVPYLVPKSHRLADLAHRQQVFDLTAKFRHASSF